MANRVRFVLKTFAIVRFLVSNQRLSKLSDTAIALFRGHTTAKDIVKNSINYSKQNMRIQLKSQRFRKKMKWYALTLASLGFTAYEYRIHYTTVPITNRKHFAIIPRSLELQYQSIFMNTFKEQYSIETDGVRQSLVLPESDTRVQLIHTLLRQLQEACVYFSPECLEYMSRMQVLVVEDEEINAFFTPGSILIINTGLLDYLQQQAQDNYKECLACVLAHELSHALSRHSIETMLYWTGIAYYLYITLVPDLILVPLIKSFSDRKLSRNKEFEADYQALYLLKRAGFDPKSMITTLSLLPDEEEGGKLLAKTKEMMASHPNNSKRVSNLNDRMDAFERDFEEHYEKKEREKTLIELCKRCITLLV